MTEWKEAGLHFSFDSVLERITSRHLFKSSKRSLAQVTNEVLWEPLMLTGCQRSFHSRAHARHRCRDLPSSLSQPTSTTGSWSSASPHIKDASGGSGGGGSIRKKRRRENACTQEVCRPAVAWGGFSHMLRLSGGLTS